MSVRNDDVGGLSFSRMKVHQITPILNVSDVAASLAWFEKWGWKMRWCSSSPLFFAAIESGHADIFLCKDAQGSRGKGSNVHTFGPDGNETADRGVWMSVWVDDVDAVYQQCMSAGLDITFPPTNMPWKAREMHVRHPDGHVFRVSKSIDEEECD